MTMYLVGPNPEKLINIANSELLELYQWSICNRVTINADKTSFMMFTTKKLTIYPLLQINNSKISRTTHTRFLGIIHDESLTFKYHIDALTLKISEHIAILYQVKYLKPQYVLKCLYYSHIYPLLTYCNLV